MSTERPVSNRYLLKIREQEASRRPYVLHYDHVLSDLRPWRWPIRESGERLSPSELVEYDVAGFLRPCCLCAVPVNETSRGYTESVVAVANAGERSGEYVVVCSTKTCGYEVYIEKSYKMLGLLVKCYEVAVNDTVGPQTRSRTRRSRDQISNGIRWKDAIRVCEPSEMETPFSKLLRLDSYGHPGLPEVEFRDLFTKCRTCDWIMTHKAFEFHECPGRVIDMDLTLDD